MPIFRERQVADVVICQNNAIINGSVSDCARNAVSMPFAFFNAVRFYAYCIFYYYYCGFNKMTPQRT